MSKKRKLFLFCAAGTVLALCALFFVAGSVGEALCLPMTIVAMGLRFLSLSGRVGNAVAIVLLVLCSLLPLALKGRRKWERQDGILVITCPTLGLGLYHLINPGLLPIALGGLAGRLALCGCVYSLLLTWGILRLLKKTKTMDTGGFIDTLGHLLYLGMGLCLAGIITELGETVSTMQKVHEGNTNPYAQLGLTDTFLGLAFLVKGAEYLLDAWVMLLGARLLRQIKEEAYGDATLRSADRLCLWCRRALVAVLLINTALQILQLLFADRLYQIDFTFSVPVLSLFLVFGMLLLAKLLGDGRRLRDENDLFV